MTSNRVCSKGSIRLCSSSQLDFLMLGAVREAVEGCNKDSKGDVPPSRESWWSCEGPCQEVLWVHEACTSAGETEQVLSEEMVGEWL